MKRYIILLLFSVFCFSQNKKLTIKEIDSICQNKGFYGSTNGKIQIKKDNLEKGNCYFTISTYLLNSELIKSNYFETTKFINKSSEEVFGDFYYQNIILIFAKVKVYKKDKYGEVQSQEFLLTEKDLNEGKPIKNLLLFDVQSWIQKKNSEILKFYNNK